MGWASYDEDIQSRACAASRPAASGPHPRRAVASSKTDARSAKSAAPTGKKGVMTSTLKEFTTSTARPLPVILLADLSGSMSVDGKIEALNVAVEEMIKTFAEEDDVRAEIHVAAITFGGQARLHLPMAAASRTKWTPVTAEGGTPMGAAFDLVTSLIEDKNQISSRAYTPTIILVSDGQPTDAWEAPLARMHASPRASKAVRLAMGIGADADFTVLWKFLSDPEIQPFRADEARKVRQFFRWVTMSVTQRSRSTNPNQRLLPAAGPDKFLGDF